MAARDDRHRVVVRGTEIFPTDTPHERRYKLAQILLDEMSPLGGLGGLLDTDGTLLQCTRAELKSGLRTRSDALGKPLWEVAWWAASPKDKENLRAAVARAAGGENVRYTVERPGVSGSTSVTIELWLIPVRDEDGRVVFLRYEGRNVAESQRLEQEIAWMNLELQQREDTEEHLEVRTEKEIRRRVDHELHKLRGLRGPLASIVPALQLLKLRGGERAEDAEGAERVRTVLDRQVRALVWSVRSLLDSSQLPPSSIEIRREVLEIADVVMDAVAAARPRVGEHEHALTIDVPRRGLRVDFDPLRLGQVVTNLLTNAARYTPPGGHITVRASREGGDVVLRVRDTGSGIGPQIFSSAFDGPSNFDRMRDDGPGLSLFIARAIVELHGGLLSAHSNGPGRGCELVVRLPARPGGDDTANAGDGRARALRVLVVDGDKDAADMLAALLAANGHDARVAYHVKAALRVAAEFSPDLAVIEIELPIPGLDGYGLAARLRALPGLERIRLIASTAVEQESDRERAQRAGFHHFCLKPVAIEDVEALVRNTRAPAPLGLPS